MDAIYTTITTNLAMTLMTILALPLPFLVVWRLFRRLFNPI